MSSKAFDALARDYDRTFSESVLGGLYRRAVWSHLDTALDPGVRALDLGCGTGVDAIHMADQGACVLAVDTSREMVGISRARAEELSRSRSPHGGRVEVRCLDIESLGALRPEAPFQVVLSNFGVLNCISSPGRLATDLAACTGSGARVFLCVMGPLVPWEWGWYLLRWEPGRAFRRLNPRGARWNGMVVRYPSIGDLTRVFRGPFRRVAVTSVGALLPPSYAEEWAGRHSRLVAFLDRWERRLERMPPLPWLADHYLLELERR